MKVMGTCLFISLVQQYTCSCKPLIRGLPRLRGYHLNLSSIHIFLMVWGSRFQVIYVLKSTFISLRLKVCATEVLASHCIEIVESSLADHDRVPSVVKSASDIQILGDMMTLTAVAATALRGEAALKSRMPKEARKNASISPYDKVIVETYWPTFFRYQTEEQSAPMNVNCCNTQQKEF